MKTEFYPPSGTFEDFDGTDFYNASGQRLRNPREYDERSEGYTPFGDE